MTNRFQMPSITNKRLLFLTVVLCLAAAVMIVVLQYRNGSDRDAELRLEQARSALTQLQTAPFAAVPPDEGDPRHARQENRLARQEIAGGKETVDEALAHLGGEASPPAALMEVPPLLGKNYAALDEIYRLGSTAGFGAKVDRLGHSAERSAGRIESLLSAAGAKYHDRAVASRDQAILGSSVVIAFLLFAFGVIHARSGRLESEKDGLLEASRQEALTDALTGLGNRRALIEDLRREIPASRPDRELILAVYDLDGFKQYNDSFGHPTGDALLSRLGGKLASLAGEGVSAYRMGGDEFCIFAELDGAGAEVAARASEALSEDGDAFHVGCSYGTVVVPTEAKTVSDALRISDQRMYSNKAVRGSASRQSIDVLLKVLEERSDGLVEHLHDVAELTTLTGRELGLDEMELNRIHTAAELHDIGKSAIPEAILNKPGKLDEGEWAFMRQHTLIGTRIVLAAPALAHTADLIRSSHERFDGQGYPEALEGEEIPLGARIIAVCDAYDAMTAVRPYAGAMSSEEAQAELDRCSGAQFDPDVVNALITVMQKRTKSLDGEGALA